MLKAGRVLRYRCVKSDKKENAKRDKKENGGTGLPSLPTISEGLNTADIKHAPGDGKGWKSLTTTGKATTTSSSSSSRGGAYSPSATTAIDEGNSTPVTGRSPASPGNSNAVVGSKIGNDYGTTPPPPKPRRFLCLLTVFAVSSLLHEATTFVAMRRTCWPFNSFCLIMSAQLHLRWDSKYPVLSYVSAASEDDVAAGEGGCGAKAKVGSEWRGWGAVAFYLGSSCPFAVLVEFLAWQWWRHAMR